MAIALTRQMMYRNAAQADTREKTAQTITASLGRSRGVPIHGLFSLNAEYMAATQTYENYRKSTCKRAWFIYEIADNHSGFVASFFGAYRTNIEDPRPYGMDFRYSF